MNKVIDLGHCMARIEESPVHKPTIVQPDEMGDAYCPAACVHIVGNDGLIALRDALNEMFPPITKENE